MHMLERVKKSSRIHHIVYDCRKSWALRDRWRADFDSLARDYKLTEEEIRALKDLDLIKLQDLGVHPFYLNPIIRLFHGEDWDDFQPQVVAAMKRAYGAQGDPASYAAGKAGTKKSA